MGTTAQKLTYLNTTKTKIKDAINKAGSYVDSDDTFRSYPDAISRELVDTINNPENTWEKFPKRTASGTNITLNGVYSAPMGTKLLGQTSQSGTPTPSSPIPVNVVSGDNVLSICGKNRLKMPTTTQTYNSRTYAISSGSLKITGNSSAENTVNLFTGQRQGAYGTGEAITRDNSIFLKAGTYTLSFSATARVSWHYIIGQIGSVFDNSNQFNNIEGNYTKTFTITQDSYFTLSFYDYSTSGQVREFTNMQLELGTATNYEPYVGSSYPIYLGVENLLPTTIYYLGIGSGGAITGNPNRYAYYCEVQPNTKYYIKRGAVGTATYWYYGFTDVVPVGGVTALSYGNMGDNLSYEVTSPNNAKYLCVFMGGGTSTNVMVSTMPSTNYYAYGTTPIELCKIGTYQDSIYKGVGSNIFNNVYSQGGIDLGNSGIDTASNTRIRSGFIEVKPNTSYTVSSENTNLESCGIGLYKSDESYDSSHKVNSGGWNNFPITFTTQSDTKYIKLSFRKNNDSNISPTGDYAIQINEGTTPLPYEPYNSKDKWLLHKEIGKVVANGTENWSTRSSGVGQLYEVDVSSYNLYSTTTLSLGLSNQYISNVNLTSDNTFRILNGSTLAIHNDTIGSLASFKSGLSTNNLIIYYPLATPTTTQITDTTLINQLDAEKKSYEAITNIGQTNNNLPFVIDVKALEKE